MTDQQAEKLATVLLSLAITGAGYWILRSPRRRRTAWRLARTALAAAGPWLVAETRTAWAQSAHAGGASASGVSSEGTGGAAMLSG